MHSAELITAAHSLGVVTGRREICEGAVKKLSARLAEWRAQVAKRSALVGLLLTGATESLVLDLERLVAVSEAELVTLRTHEEQLKRAFDLAQRAANQDQPPPIKPRPLRKCGPVKAKRTRA